MARVNRALLAVALAAWLSGCQSWSRIQIGPDFGQRVERAHDEQRRVRISYADGPVEGDGCPGEFNRFEAEGPRIEGDSLYHSRTAYRPIPIAHLCRLEQRVTDANKTFLAIVGGVAGGLVLALAIWAATCDPDAFIC